jgi:hypothetical protein
MDVVGLTVLKGGGIERDIKRWDSTYGLNRRQSTPHCLYYKREAVATARMNLI